MLSSYEKKLISCRARLESLGKLPRAFGVPQASVDGLQLNMLTYGVRLKLIEDTNIFEYEDPYFILTIPTFDGIPEVPEGEKQLIKVEMPCDIEGRKYCWGAWGVLLENRTTNPRYYEWRVEFEDLIKVEVIV